MSETTPDPTPVPEASEVTSPAADPAAEGAAAVLQLPPDHPLVKTLAAQKEQIRDLKEKGRRLDEIDEAAKTDLQKAIDRAEAAEKALAAREAAEATAQLIKDVASEKGFADRGISADALRGSTREELEAHADQILSLIPVKPKAPSADGQGNTGAPIESAAQITSREQLKSMSPAEVEAARQDGRLDSLLGK